MEVALQSSACFAYVDILAQFAGYVIHYIYRDAQKEVSVSAK